MEIGVGSSPTWESKTGPCADRFFVGDHLHSVPRINLARSDFFGLIPTQAMVKDNIGNYVDTCCVKGVDRSQILFLCPVLCPDASLLIELTQVVHIVDAVADILASHIALIGRRKPDTFDSQVRNVLRRSGNASPEALIGREIPREGLQKQMIVKILRLRI